METDTEQSTIAEGEGKRAREGEGKKEICSCLEQLHKGDEVLTSDLRYGHLKQHTELMLKHF